MENKTTDLDKLQQDLDKNAVRLQDVPILFLDLSSTCTGWAVVNYNFERKIANFTNCGAIWFGEEMSNAEKYHFLYKAITEYFYIVLGVSFCFAESYMININKRMGCQVGSELHGALQVALQEVNLKYQTIPPQSWRKILSIKKDEKGKYKENTAKRVAEFVKLPEEILSNVTKNKRKLPNDITDVLAMAIAQSQKLGFRQLTFNNLKIQEDIGAVNL